MNSIAPVAGQTRNLQVERTLKYSRAGVHCRSFGGAVSTGRQPIRRLTVGRQSRLVSIVYLPTV